MEYLHSQQKSPKCLGAISKMTEWSLFVSKAESFNITVIQVYAPTSNDEEAEVERFYEDLQDLLEHPKKDVFFIIGDWNAKLGSQETPGVTDTFGLGMQNEAGQRLIEFCQENTLVIANTLSNNTKEDPTREHHEMANTEIILITFLAGKDGEALYSQQKQDWELIVAQIMNFLLPNSDLNWRKQGKPLDHSAMT